MQATLCDPAPMPTLATALDELTADLQVRLNGRVRDLRLDLRGHGLVLHGSTSTYYIKQVAQHVLMKLAALPIVANEIRVAAVAP